MAKKKSDAASMKHAPSLGGQQHVSNAPALPHNRKQVAGLGKNQKAVMGYLIDENRAVTWEELREWWGSHLSARYERPITPLVDDFNQMLTGLSRRKLIVVKHQPSGRVQEALFGWLSYRSYSIEVVQLGGAAPEKAELVEEVPDETPGCPECPKYIDRCPRCGRSKEKR